MGLILELQLEKLLFKYYFPIKNLQSTSLFYLTYSNWNESFMETACYILSPLVHSKYKVQSEMDHSFLQIQQINKYSSATDRRSIGPCQN